jgi:hypothetical protein
MQGLIITLLCMTALNIWATLRVLAAADGLENKKNWLLAGIWMLPCFGALVALNHASVALAQKRADRAQAVAVDPAHERAIAAPSLIESRTGASFEVVSHLSSVSGIPILDWRALDEWAGCSADTDGDGAAVDTGRRAWLLHLRDALGPHFDLIETDAAYVLTSLEPRIAKATIDFVVKTRRRVQSVLTGIAAFLPGEKSILVVFDSEEDYYHYVSIYYPKDGEFATSGGMFIHFGCPHFVLVRADLSNIEPVIAHELTHSALAHLRLPKWLDEGIAVNTEHKLTGEKRLLYTPHELHRKHAQYWNQDSIQAFWSGASFERTNDGNLLSYELARIIVEQLARDWDAFARFVVAADRADAGAAAAQSVFAVDLGRCASALLEIDQADGWSPRPA